MSLQINNLYLGECLTLMKDIQDKSIDLILCDLPYGGVTDFKWDSPIDLVKLWESYNRILTKTGVVCLNATQPFGSTLINSNPKNFKYEYVWIKTQAANFQLAKYMPLKKHESVLVFYAKKPIYNPQMWKGEMKPKRIGKKVDSTRKTDMYLSSKPENLEIEMSDTYYPTTILNFPSVARNKSQHPTQKPVGLCEFLIKTYTNEGATVLDNCMGSGTTCLAAKNLNRNWIGIEQDEKYFNVAKERLTK